MFTKVNKQKISEMSEGVGNYISESGIYKLTIDNASVVTTKNGATQINFGFTDENGSSLTVYGLTVTNKQGEPIFGMDILNSLVALADLEGLSDPVERTIMTGKDQDVEKNILVLEDLDNVEIYVQLQKEYSKYKGKIKEKLNIKKFFHSETKQSATEYINESESKQYEKSLEYASKDKYTDVTPEEVQAYQSSKDKKSDKTDEKPTKKSPFQPKGN